MLPAAFLTGFFFFEDKTVLPKKALFPKNYRGSSKGS
jgi:hypothetical protein